MGCYLESVMLKILRSGENGSVVFSLCGRIEESDLLDLQGVIDTEPKAADLTLDLQEVRLVHREALRFFVVCEAKGIKLTNCPAYIREWFGDRREASHET